MPTSSVGGRKVAALVLGRNEQLLFAVMKASSI
jgi:hypothetical protein